MWFFPLENEPSLSFHLHNLHTSPEQQFLSQNKAYLAKKAISIMAQEFDSSFPSLPSQNLKGESHSSAEDKFSNEATSQHSSPSDHKDNYEHLDHSQLKALCKDKGYATSGKTNTLIQRLRTHDARAMGAEGKESKDSSRSSVSLYAFAQRVRSR